MKITGKQQKHQCRKAKCQLGKCLKLRNGTQKKQVDIIRKTVQKNNEKQFEKIPEKFAVYAQKNNRYQKTIMEIKIGKKITRIKSWKCFENI